MNMKENVLELAPVQNVRELFIEQINEAENRTDYAKNNADSLYAMGLTMYSGIYSFESAIYNGLATSYLDSRISLHPEQLKILETIEKNKGTIFSAPTSFGKTFTVFEYIARKRPKCVVMVVPTLALVDEYKRKVLNEYRNFFSSYKIYLSIDNNKQYDLEDNNIFIVTHERVIDDEVQQILSHIDFLVIDEVYKLQRDDTNDRILILNMAYYNLVSIANKYVLLAPFIKGVENLDKLDDKPVFYGTNFSPVVNKVIPVRILDGADDERWAQTSRLLKEIQGNTLVYFPTVVGLNKYIVEESPCIDVQEQNPLIMEFVSWAKREVHEKWSVVKALEGGFLVHHGQLPLGIRMLELDLFNQKNGYNVILCTSTLLEGINTDAENIIITKPCRSTIYFDAFDFFNLVGRTGRLFKHYLGKAYYIQGPEDPDFKKEEALKSIEFELTTDSIDIDINKGNGDKHQEYIDFLHQAGISEEDYLSEVASKFRFSTVLSIYDSYINARQEIIDEVNLAKEDRSRGKIHLIRCLYKAIGEKPDKKRTFIINLLTYKRRQKLKDVIDKTCESFKISQDNDVQRTISDALYLKNSYIEHCFYKKSMLIIFFMRCDHISDDVINHIRDNLLKTIENLYYINKPGHKMLKEMGVYDADIDSVIKVIGSDFNSAEELKTLISENINRIKVSIVSRYVLERLIK